MSMFQRIRDGEGLNIWPVLRSLWHIATGLVALLLLVLAFMHALHNDFARAAFEIALVIFIRPPEYGRRGQP